MWFWQLGCLVCLLLPASSNGAGAVETAGDIIQYVLPVSAVGVSVAHRDSWGLAEFGASAGVTLAATYGLKYAVTERRPNGGSQSFPSGHSSISFASAEYLRKRYGWEYGVPAYALASFVAYSRVEARQHHPHDVVAGAAIGILSSYIFTRPYLGWHVQAEASPDYYGLRLSRRW